MKEYQALFMFTIGPVKSFINNGRKMKDLYSGSAILSALTGHALEAIEGMNGFDVIFPKSPKSEEGEGKSEKDENKGITSYPNRLVATVKMFSTDKEKIDAKKAAKELEDKIKVEFEEICKGAFKEKSENVRDDEEVMIELASKQIKSFFEVYWAFEPCVDQNDLTDRPYGLVYGQLFQNLSSIKNIRTFGQVNEHWSRKCGLHSEYNALFYKQEQAYLNIDCRYQLPQIPKFEFLVKKKETLSAIAFAKRFYKGPDPAIVSTRDMVFKKRLELYYGDDSEKGKAWYEENVEKRVGEHKTHRAGIITSIIDAVYDQYPKAVSTPQEENKFAKDKAKEIVTDIKKEIPELKLKSYYAMLKFDGDNMGDRYKDLKSKEDHEKLSKKICVFAAEARKIVEDAGGICIYAGGEDILAALPLEEIWEKLKELHKAFLKTVKIEGQSEITFSAGIVVAHLMEPLKDVMYRLDESEKDAKNYLGKYCLSKEKNLPPKNAFSIKLMKRAGEYRDIRFSFDHQPDDEAQKDTEVQQSSENKKDEKDQKGYESLENFKLMIKQLEDEQHSKSFLTNIIHLVGQLPKSDEKLEDNENLTLDERLKKKELQKNEKWEMIEALIKASVGRQSFEKVKSAKVLEQVKVLYQSSESIKNFTNTLDIIRFLASNAIIHNGGDS